MNTISKARIMQSLLTVLALSSQPGHSYKTNDRGSYPRSKRRGKYKPSHAKNQRGRR